MTILVESIKSLRVNQDTFLSSAITSVIKFRVLLNISYILTGLVGLEPTTHGFGDRRSTIGATGLQVFRASGSFFQFFV